MFLLRFCLVTSEPLCPDHRLRSLSLIWWCWTNKGKNWFKEASATITAHMDQEPRPAAQFEVDVDLGFALFFLFLLCFFLLVTVVRCAQTVVDPYGSISTSTYQEEQIT